MPAENDVESEMKTLWSDYHAARADDFRSYDFAAVSSRLRSLRAKAKKEGLTALHMQLGDLSDSLARAKQTRMTPDEQLAAYWPGLVQAKVEYALTAAESALRVGDVSKLRQAARLLSFCERPERLADIAEDGLAKEFAARIPGATEDEGMLILSKDHEALLERATMALSRVQTAIRSGGSSK